MGKFTKDATELLKLVGGKETFKQYHIVSLACALYSLIHQRQM